MTPTQGTLRSMESGSPAPHEKHIASFPYRQCFYVAFHDAKHFQHDSHQPVWQNDASDRSQCLHGEGTQE